MSCANPQICFSCILPSAVGSHFLSKQSAVVFLSIFPQRPFEECFLGTFVFRGPGAGGQAPWQVPHHSDQARQHLPIRGADGRQASIFAGECILGDCQRLVARAILLLPHDSKLPEAHTSPYSPHLLKAPNEWLGTGQASVNIGKHLTFLIRAAFDPRRCHEPAGHQSNG